MILINKSVFGNTTVCAPLLTKEDQQHVSYAVAAYSYILKVDVDYNGEQFASLIRQCFDNERSNFLADLLERVEKIRDHYVYVVSAEIQKNEDHKPALIAAHNELNELVRAGFREGYARAFPFTFTTSEGKNALAFVFGESKDEAYKLVECLSDFRVPGDIDSGPVTFLHSGMTTFTTRINITDFFYNSPSLNYVKYEKAV